MAALGIPWQQPAAIAGAGGQLETISEHNTRQPRRHLHCVAFVEGEGARAGGGGKGVAFLYLLRINLFTSYDKSTGAMSEVVNSCGTCPPVNMDCEWPNGRWGSIRKAGGGG